MIREKIFIKIKQEPFTFEQVLKILADYFKPAELKFIGWHENLKVIRVNNDNYKVFIFKDKISLNLTTSKNIKVTSYRAKLEAFERYTTFLKNIYEK